MRRRHGLPDKLTAEQVAAARSALKKIDVIIEREMREEIVDCARRCHWCCHQLVILTNWDDGRAILRAVRERLDDDEFADFEARLRDQATAIAKLSHEQAEAKRWTCPLLSDRQCLVYDVRPVACRSVFSSDSDCCRAMMETEDIATLTPEHQTLAAEIGERAMRLQIEANDTRPIHGAIELRALLVRLLDEI